jgi:Dyp-type peroxidase family
LPGWLPCGRRIRVGNPGDRPDTADTARYPHVRPRPAYQFIPIQMKLGLGDRLSEYVQHTGSALFAIPPGITQGEHIGQALFA